MPTRASKQLKEAEEVNSAALRVMALTTGQAAPAKEKNAAAVALGRAASMSAAKRKEIAKKAAATRWKKA